MQIEQLKETTIQAAIKLADKTATGGWSEAFRAHLFEQAFQAGMEEAAKVCETVTDKKATSKTYADAIRVVMTMME